MEEAVTRLKDAQIKLNKLADEIAVLATNDDTLVAATRSQEIHDTILKARDMSQEIFKLLQPHPPRGADQPHQRADHREGQGRHHQPARRGFEATLPQERGVRRACGADLNESRKPGPDVVRQAEADLAALIEKLEQVQLGMGEIMGIQKLVRMIAEIERTQSKDIGSALDALKKRIIEEEFITRIETVPVVMERNQKGKFKVALKRAIDFDGEVTLKFTVPLASELKLPAEVKIKEGGKSADVEITAGRQKPGIHVITVRPTTADATRTIEPISVKVTVR